MRWIADLFVSKQSMATGGGMSRINRWSLLIVAFSLTVLGSLYAADEAVGE